jgi:hypothetical protein
METYNKPLPGPSALTAPFWEAAHEGRLELQHCKQCNSFQYYPRKVCGNCWSEDIKWQQCSGKGSVYSYSICRIPTFPGFEQDVPYVVAMVELEEGVRMTSNIIACPVTDVYIGMQVEAVFDAVTEDCSLVKFRPASNQP